MKRPCDKCKLEYLAIRTSSRFCGRCVRKRKTTYSQLFGTPEERAKHQAVRKTLKAVK